MNEEKTNRKSVQLEELLIKDIIPSGDNPRTINEKSTAFIELTENIRAQGVIVPVHVRIHPKQKNKFELLAGERRMRATTTAGRGLIPAINHGKINNEQAFEITFTENYAREDLTPLEQGKAVVTLLEKYKGDAEAVASKMGRSIKWVRQRQALGTKLNTAWQKAVNEADNDNNLKHWTASHLQRVASLPDPMQEEMLNTYFYNDQPTLKELDAHIAEILQLLNKAPFDTSAAGCTKCPKRTSCQPGLFDDDLDPQALKKNDRCLDKLCWQRKTLAWLKDKFTAQKKDLPGLVAITTDYPGYGWFQVLRQTWPGFIREYDFKQAGKKSKGAIPGFIIYGKAIGTVLWIKPAVSAAESRSEKSTGKPTPLKQRRVLLEAKRWSRVLIELSTKVEEAEVSQLSCKDKVISLMALVSVYVNESLWSSNTATCQKEIKRLIEHNQKNPTDAYSEALVSLWNSFKTTLDQLLNYNGPITQTPKHKMDDARWIAKLISVDIDKIFEEVSKQKGFTEPKSWATLNADGTPKKAEKARKKPTKAKKPSKVRTCRECGCTDDKPCITKEGPCSWAKKDLCSACVPTVKRREAHDKS